MTDVGAVATGIGTGAGSDRMGIFTGTLISVLPPALVLALALSMPTGDFTPVGVAGLEAGFRPMAFGRAVPGEVLGTECAVLVTGFAADFAAALAAGLGAGFAVDAFFTTALAGWVLAAALLSVCFVLLGGTAACLALAGVAFTY